MRRKNGFALTEVLIAVGLIGVVALAMAEMMSAQSKNTKALTEKLGSLSAKNLLTGLMANGAVCMYELNSPSARTFNSTNSSTAAASSISLNSIHNGPTATSPVAFQVGQPASPDSPSLVLTSIQVTNFIGSGTSYVADWTLHFDQSRLVRSIRPVTVQVAMQVDNTVPSATRITGCNTTGTSASPTVNVTNFGWADTGTSTPINRALGCHSFCALTNVHDCSNCGYAVTPTAGTCANAAYRNWTVTQARGSMNVACIDL